MAFAIVLFAGFIGIALTASVAVLAFIDVAFSLSEGSERARRNARYAVQPAAEALSPKEKLARIHQWAQTA
jgi:hypothetical protein